MSNDREQILFNALDMITHQVEELKVRVEKLALENVELRKENLALSTMVQIKNKIPTLTEPARVAIQQHIMTGSSGPGR